MQESLGDAHGRESRRVGRPVVPRPSVRVGGYHAAEHDVVLLRYLLPAAEV